MLSSANLQLKWSRKCQQLAHDPPKADPVWSFEVHNLKMKLKLHFLYIHESGKTCKNHDNKLDISHLLSPTPHPPRNHTPKKKKHEDKLKKKRLTELIG